jgi:hypothetical protein
MTEMETIIMKIIGVNKIKYGVLDREICNLYTNYGMVNVHIDLNTILKPLFTEDNEKNMDTGSYEYHISSGILNLVAHFRAYFAYKKNLKTKFFLYYCNSELDNGCKYFKDTFKSIDYKNIFYSIEKALELVDIISTYCGGVYYINTKSVEPAVAMNHFINTKSESSRNLIITKDEMLYQLINVGDTEILRLKRDESEMIDVSNIYEFILRKTKYDSTHMASELLSLYMAYSGIKTRNVQGVCKTKIIKVIDKAIESGKLLNEYYPKVEYAISDGGLPDAEIVIANFDKVDIHTRFKELSRPKVLELNNCIIDKYSRDDLRNLNIKYYTDELYLMLEELVLTPKSKNVIEW